MWRVLEHSQLHLQNTYFVKVEYTVAKKWQNLSSNRSSIIASGFTSCYSNLYILFWFFYSVFLSPLSSLFFSTFFFPFLSGLAPLSALLSLSQSQSTALSQPRGLQRWRSWRCNRLRRWKWWWSWWWVCGYGGCGFGFAWVWLPWGWCWLLWWPI